MDPEATYPNSLTSCSSQSSPMCMKNDKETIQAAIKICGGVQPENVRLIRIRDTLHVSDILVSENMIDSIRSIPGITIGNSYEWTFDKNGNLWMTNSEGENGIKILDTANKWHSLYVESLKGKYTINDIHGKHWRIYVFIWRYGYYCAIYIN